MSTDQGAPGDVMLWARLGTWRDPLSSLGMPPPPPSLIRAFSACSKSSSTPQCFAGCFRPQPGNSCVAAQGTLTLRRRTAAQKKVCPSVRSGTQMSLLGADVRFLTSDWISEIGWGFCPGAHACSKGWRSRNRSGRWVRGGDPLGWRASMKAEGSGLDLCVSAAGSHR